MDQPTTIAADEPLKAAIRAGAALMGLPIDPAWENGVAFNLRTLLAQGAAITDPPLSDALDPAPVFRA